MDMVGKVSGLITQGMYSVATPFHPFGGAVDIIVVKQKDGSFKSTPWYVRFGKFQGFLKGAEKIVRIEVNGVEADFCMYLDNSGEAYFVCEADCGDDKGGVSHLISNDVDSGENDYEVNGKVEVRDERKTLGMDRLDRGESSGPIYDDFQEEPQDSDSLYNVDHELETQDSNSEVVLFSVDGHVITAPISSSENNDERVQSNERSEKEEIAGTSDCFNGANKSHRNDCIENEHESGEILPSDRQLETLEGDNDESPCVDTSSESKSTGLQREEEVFKSCLELPELAPQSMEDDERKMDPLPFEDPPKNSPESLIENDEIGAGYHETVRAEQSCGSSSSEEVFVDSLSVSPQKQAVEGPTDLPTESPRVKIVRTNVPTSDQIASLNLKEGQNMVDFIFSTRVLGTQKVDAHIYVWKWNTRIVISDVDGTITKSDVLGQFMPLFGRDWTHSGIARLFSAIKENGYQLLFLSARAIVQAYLTKSFLSNLKQEGKSMPIGPVVISPDGLFPSLYREMIRRAPHEFKIACLEDIKALFPRDYNPFYAGFGNRDTDELSYQKIGIPKGKIFIINPQGEVAVDHRIDVKSYTSLHTLVDDMFPPTSLLEQEDYNSWNYWKMPLPDIDDL